MKGYALNGGVLKFLKKEYSIEELSRRLRERGISVRL